MSDWTGIVRGINNGKQATTKLIATQGQRDYPDYGVMQYSSSDAARGDN